MVCRARLSARSPPRLSRWRTVCPLLASRGLAPASAANAASLRTRPGWEKLTTTWAATTGPTPRRAVSPGARSSTMVCSWARLAVKARRAARTARARRRISAWRTAWARVASWGRRRRASAVRAASVSALRASRPSSPSPSRRSARSRLVCAVLVRVRSWRASSRIAHGIAVAVGAGGREPVDLKLQGELHGQVRVDRVGLAPPAANLAGGLLGLDHRQAGGAHGAGYPEAVAAGALDRDHQSGAGGVLGDPGQQPGVAAGVVGDRAGRGRCSGRQRDLDLMGVAVGVDADHGVDAFC